MNPLTCHHVDTEIDEDTGDEYCMNPKCEDLISTASEREADIQADMGKDFYRERVFGDVA